MNTITIEIVTMDNENFSVYNNAAFKLAVQGLTGRTQLTVNDLVCLQKLGFSFITVNI